MPGCPHANRAVITWKLLGLDKAISLATAGIYRSPKGWVFSEDPGQIDPLLKVHYLHDLYLKSDPSFTGRSTVPAITDVRTGIVVNNDHTEIPYYFMTDWKKFHKKNAPELYPHGKRKEIRELGDWIFQRLNSGPYDCGFARSQKALDEGYEKYFSALDEMEKRLGEYRFLMGDYITDSDIRLFPSLVRFRQDYYLLYRCNKKRLDDYRNLWAYARDLYQTPGFKEMTHLDLIKKHYQTSPHLRPLWGNRFGLYAKGPQDADWELPSERERLSGRKEKFLKEEHQGGSM